MKNKQKNIVIIALTALILFFIGCTAVAKNDDSIIKEDISRDIIFDESINEISSWLVYWNLDINEELSSLGNKLKRISYFEAYFNEKYEIILPDELVEYFEETKYDNYEKYLTFVNDVKKDDDNFSLKDVNMIKEILSDSEACNKYIDDIIGIAEDNGFDGVDIDFEGIKNDIELWNEYIDFINKLYDKCKQSELKVRIILEPSTPIENLDFKEGPAYIMMCYNLHGSSTEPGEKANPKFINKLMDKMEKIHGTKEFAVATGGYDWNGNGEIASVDEKKAEELLKKYNADKKRDSDSGCLYFEYKDEKNIKHDVWYADKHTLNKWMKIINERGYKVNLWRLGGNKF